ncbi:ABC transporter permease [Aureibacillus halotolerans]|uniref:ABC-2 type transport system permease protein n=1 Tax=Aureibacillus halotolerans TaxID=1508390 RepID=A0A4R6U5H2_9BACI|nr:ABC transporter permease [Aureibacillus halotolerans]TDQ40792.1 ABC-2 type transport system permease protein [Aureibacillus halotolerans]
MIRLIQNEWMKVWARKSQWVWLALLGVGIAVVLILTFRTAAPAEQDWKALLLQENQQHEQTIAEGSEWSDPTMLRADIRENNYRIQHDLPPERMLQENVWSFLRSSVHLLNLVGLMVIIMAATIVSTEFKTGTIKLLLVRPPSRFRVLMSKYLTVVVYALMLASLLFGLSFLIGSICFGFEDRAVDILHRGDQLIERSAITGVLIEYATSIIHLLVIGTLAFAISTIFKSDKMSIILSLLAYYGGTITTGVLLAFFDWAKYLFFINADLGQYFSSEGAILEGMTLGFSITILLLHWLLFIGAAALIFQKREITTGE